MQFTSQKPSWAAIRRKAQSNENIAPIGSLLIEHELADDFHGKVHVDYLPQGLRCELATRLDNLRA